MPNPDCPDCQGSGLIYSYVTTIRWVSNGRVAIPSPGLMGSAESPCFICQNAEREKPAHG